MIKNVIFDFNGVIRLIKNVTVVDILKKNHLENFSEKRYKNMTLTDFFSDKRIAKMIELWDLGFDDLDHLIKRSAMALKEKREIVKVLYEAVISPQYNIIIPQTVELIKKLKKKGYKLFILSNLSVFIKDACAKILDYSLFNDTIFSCDVKMVKPNLDIYFYLLKKWQINLEETVFVDDSSSNLKNFFFMDGHIFLFRSHNAREINKSIKELEHLIHVVE